MRKEIKQGVSQVSVLGHLLFLVYITDLTLNSQDADDININILTTDKNIDAIQEGLNRVIKQSETWF